MVAINKFLKRLFDIVSSGIAIIILIPLWIIIAIAIKKDSKGPSNKVEEQQMEKYFICINFAQ